MTFWEYISELFNDVPLYVYLSLVVVFITGTVLLLLTRGLNKGMKDVMVLLFLEYVFLLYSSTVVYRSVKPDIRYNLTPFWSYKAIAKGDNTGLLPENIMNVAVFIPLGIILGIAVKQRKKSDGKYKTGWLGAIMVGLLLSLGIEISQYLLKKGLAETDDVIHNTTGCFIGYFLVVGILQFCKYFKQYK